MCPNSNEDKTNTHTPKIEKQLFLFCSMMIEKVSYCIIIAAPEMAEPTVNDFMDVKRISSSSGV